ncbi:hypothetical protein C1I98_12350 [Spongiactinospora gelatinilytica]|uniref:Uncharacterized protein n=1 Tax=Spongiactinospora gelatinilytica TaxID=2666298 RepID=A0A2W2HSC4_9ACTN|nr:hypothetical protein C1I98_12350 [Spongiactinospora gelatinilytica]
MLVEFRGVPARRTGSPCQKPSGTSTATKHLADLQEQAQQRRSGPGGQRVRQLGQFQPDPAVISRRYVW